MKKIISLFAAVVFVLVFTAPTNRYVVAEEGVRLSNRAATSTKGSQKNSYSLLFGPNVLGDSYQIVYTDTVSQVIRDNVDTAAAQASTLTGKRISTAPGTYTITIDVTTEDVCGNGCTYTSYDAAVGVIIGATVKLESWIADTYNRCLAVHELGHALGLAHVTDTRQIMAPVWSANSSPCMWAQGDTYGLKAAGG